MTRKTRIALFSCIATVALSAQAGAVVAFNNFGAGDTFNTGTGWTASGPTSSAGAVQSISQFTSSASGSLLSITAAVSLAAGSNSAQLWLYNDSGSDTIGSAITGWSFGSLPAFGGSFSPTVLFNGFPSITLTAGSKYWIGVNPGASDTWAVWNWNSTGNSGPHGASTNGGASYTYDTNTAGAMRVEVVPEPATMTALALGVVALLRRRKKA